MHLKDDCLQIKGGIEMKFYRWQLVFFLASFTLHANAQQEGNEFNPTADLYRLWIKDIGCDSFYYAEQIDSISIDTLTNLLSYTNIFEEIGSKKDSIKNKIILTTIEQSQLIEQIKAYKGKKVLRNMFPKSKLLKNDSIAHFINMVDQSRDDMKDQLCKSVHYFSMPIYFRNKTYCIYYYGKSSVLVNEGDFSIYRNTNGQWRKVCILYNWVETEPFKTDVKS